ncbi:ephrin-B2a-like [Sinocyclocheilus anshuiensis]|uniref:ephrin-B2a-like n=1 Tax=Sinocyclocheilus anshuiensis TaxID=1608454 RepID=UPI0007BA3635|nr:PREDICTED: ephrin-B2a-like [Sinocyclocheilus anshuiensis]
MGDSLWRYYFGVLVIACKVNLSRAIILDSIYWNTTNTKFVPGQGLVLYPQIGDKMDIVCPRVEGGSTEGVEYYKLYMVPLEQLKSCQVTKADIAGNEIALELGAYEYPSDPFSPKEYPTSYPPKHPDVGGKNTKSNEVLDKPDAAHQGEEKGDGNKSSSVIGSEVALFACIASASVIVIIIIIMLVFLLLKYRRHHRKHSPQHATTLSLSTLATPKRGGSGGNNNGSEPSDIIIPLRTADSVFCPHYEKVSGDYGHPVYIVQEMPPQSPANIYYKV